MRERGTRTPRNGKFERVLWIDAANRPMVRSDTVGSERMLPHGRIGCAILIAVPLSHLDTFFPSATEYGRLSWVN